MDTSLILFSGLPGTGKTTLAHLVARKFHIPIFAKDRIERFLRDSSLTDGKSIYSYYLLFDLADQQLELGTSVILDAVFPKAGFRQVAREIAVKHHARFLAVYTYYSDERTFRQRMENRVQYVPGWVPVGWDEAQHVKSGYEPWSPEDALFIDAINPLQENVDKLFEYIQDQGRTTP